MSSSYSSSSTRTASVSKRLTALSQPTKLPTSDEKDARQTMLVPTNSPSVVSSASGANPSSASESSPSHLELTSSSKSSSTSLSLKTKTTANDDKTDDPDASPASIKRPVGAGRPGVTAPLVSIDELFDWRPTGTAARCVSTVPLSDAAIRRYIRGGMDRLTAPSASSMLPPSLSSSRSSLSSSSSLKRLQPPRLLVCHDFAGGYPLWEANATGVSGDDDCPPDSKLWRFNHWAYVDVFVYFSHYCVTVPPVGFIHAAHRHGALILGTVIFEWEQGAVELAKVLASYKTRLRAAEQLAAMAKFFGFDGWLLNVEVDLMSSTANGGNGAGAGSVPSSASSSMSSDLAAFAGDLTRATRKVLGPASEVVWYDSVTRSGALAWQNELNEQNEQFFKMTTAMFTNYHWDRNAPVRSAVRAGTRRADVFTGVDVHGRNTFGGGGFHTHIALRAIKQGGTSAAIFAPAWTVENCPPQPSSTSASLVSRAASATDVPDPRDLDHRFWTGPVGRFGRECVAQYFRERPVITDLPFETNFDPGWGPRLMRNGNVKSPHRYFNMAQQQIQPSFLRPVVAGGDPNAADLVLSHEQAYNGSAAVKVSFAFSQSRMLSGTFAILRLFVANIAFAPRASSIPATPTNNSMLMKPNPSLSVSPKSSITASTTASSSAAAASANSNTTPHSSSSSLRLSASSLASSVQPPDGSVKVVYHYFAQCEASDYAAAANDFAVVLMFGSPAGAVLLVGQNSRWNMDARQRRALPRLQISGKFVDMIIVVATSDRRAFGAPSPSERTFSSATSAAGDTASSSGWMTRTFTLSRSLVSAQRLVDVMVIVGGPPEQPISVRASPALSPNASLHSSRVGSRVGSRAGSRVASRSTSRAASPPRHPKRRSVGVDANDTNRHPNNAGIPHMEADQLRLPEGGSGFGVGGMSGSETPTSLSSASSDVFGSSLLNRYRGSVTGRRRSLNPGASGFSGGGDGEMYGGELSAARRRPPIGMGAESVYDGQLSFEAMQVEEDVANNASMQMSRFYSRGTTPGGGSSHMSSRLGSLAGSLAGSRAASTVVSPSYTPSYTPRSAAGPGARPLPRSNLMSPASRSGCATPSGSGSEAISELKSALMHAAGTMATGGTATVAGAEGQEQAGSIGNLINNNTLGVVKVVYLGGLLIEEQGVVTRAGPNMCSPSAALSPSGANAASMSASAANNLLFSTGGRVGAVGLAGV